MKLKLLELVQKVLLKIAEISANTPSQVFTFQLKAPAKLNKK